MNEFNRVDSIIREVIVNKGEDTTNNYPRYLNYAIRGINQMNIDRVRNVKAVTIAVDNLRRATLPNDFLCLVKVGLENGEAIVELAVRPNINKTIKKDENGDNVPPLARREVTPVNGPSIDSYLPYNNYFFGTNVDETVRGFDTRGFYTIDSVNGQILLSSEFTEPEVYVEYVADVNEVCETTILEPLMQEYILRYVEYQAAKNDMSVPMNRLMLMEREMKEAKAQAKRNMNRISIANLYKFVRESKALTLTS